MSPQTKSKQYTKDNTLHWLTWLAKSLRDHAQTEFLIEKLQPSWLPSLGQKWLYHIFVVLIIAMAFRTFDWFIDSLVAHLIPEGRLTSAVGDAVQQKLKGDVSSSFSVLFNMSLALIVGLILGLMQTIRPIETVHWSGARAWSEMARGSRRWGIPGLKYGPYVGLVAGLFASLLFYLKFTFPSELVMWGRVGAAAGILIAAVVVFFLIARPSICLNGELRDRVIDVLMIAVVGWLISGVITWLTGALLLKVLGIQLIDWMSIWLYSWVGVGATAGLVAGLIATLLRKKAKPVQTLQGPATALWNWGAFRWRQWLIAGVVAASISSLILVLLMGMGQMRTVQAISGMSCFFGMGFVFTLCFLLFSALMATAIAGSFGALLGALFGMLRGGLTGPDIERRTAPNQGIRKSAINAATFALIGGLTLGTFWGLLNLSCAVVMTRLVPEASDWLRFLLPNVLFFGLLSGLVPGAAGIQHFALRFILWCRGLAPWDYASFLDYATERMLLQRVGGRYWFMHELLRDHFAAIGRKRVES